MTATTTLDGRAIQVGGSGELYVIEIRADNYF
jgi:hypothetical protein